MKIFGFVYSESHLPPKQENSIIAQQGGGQATLTTRDDNGGFGTGQPHPDPTRLFFSISKPIPFKKLNRTGWGPVGKDGKILKPAPFTFDFCFYFFIFSFLFYYIKINIFHKK